MTAEEMPDPTAAAVPSRPLHARMRNFKGTVLVSVDSDVLELSETAAVIWRLIDGRRTVDDIALLLVQQYDIDTPTALADVAELLGRLARMGAVVY